LRKAERYDYHVIWSESDNAFIATVAEFPSLSHVDDSQVAALTGIVDLVDSILKDMESNG